LVALDLDQLADGVRKGDRALLGRAITLIESRLPEHREQAERLLEELVAETGNSHRVGITGVPGVGKSTFIEALGMGLIRGDYDAPAARVAVLAVDPTSRRTGGSILGDKTRMQSLAASDAAFIRPSPTAGTLGGVTRRTRETMMLCEAAGYDVVIVETVGAGQSETQVSEMVDFFLVLMLPGAGDELQGIKKGVLELADMIAVNKADGDNQKRARVAAAEYRSALHIMAPQDSAWQPPVLTCSGLTGEGLAELWHEVARHRAVLSGNGELAARRRHQQLDWMWSLVEERLIERLRASTAVQKQLVEIERKVEAGEMTAGSGADRLLALARD
jgi:LAO/AO transport system kinase